MSNRIDPEQRINQQWTVESLEEEFEGQDFTPSDPSKDHFICDFCSKGVAYKSNPRVGHYIADKVLNENHPALSRVQDGHTVIPLASYCEECTTRMLLFPCTGFAEVRMLFNLDEEKVIHDVDITDVSPRDDGVPWDPKEVSERVTRVPFEANALLAGPDHLWGPENMVTFFLSVVKETDIRELVDWEGNIDPKVLGQARKNYEQFQREMEKQGHSREAFKKSVRGSR